MNTGCFHLCACMCEWVQQVYFGVLRASPPCPPFLTQVLLFYQLDVSAYQEEAAATARDIVVR